MYSTDPSCIHTSSMIKEVKKEGEINGLFPFLSFPFVFGMEQEEQPREESWECDSNHALSITLVRGEEEHVFHPVFTYHTFGTQQVVHGYHGLRIDIRHDSSSLFIGLGVKWQEATPNATDALKLVREKLAGTGFTEDAQNFAAHVGEPFTPPGEPIDHFTHVQEDGNVREFVVLRGCFEDAEIRAYHRQMRLFALWFIEGASFINEDDPRWLLFMLFERTSEGRHHFLGYATVYRFLAFLDNERMRVSQFVILPPFQGQGHGARLLETIYHEAQRKSVYEVTVEDPTPAFARFRDTVEMRLLLHEKMAQGHYPTEADITAVRSRLKICKPQQIRLAEVLAFSTLDEQDEETCKTFRLRVKRRLLKRYQEDLSILSLGERKEKLDVLFREEEASYRRVVEALRRSRDVHL